MGLEIRPTTQTLVVNYVVTLGILGGIIFFSQGKPSAYYYSPAYDDHAGPDYSSLSCNACHSEPFRKVLNTDCTNSQCHQQYMPEYTGWRDRQLYTGDWTSIRESAPEELVRVREDHASVAYHHHELVATMDCTSCHTTHTPPPDGMPIHFDHRPDSSYLPEGLSYIHCTNCHTYVQAPPTRAHEEMLNARTGDCWDCHLSSNSWTEKVESKGAAGAMSLAEARLAIGESVASIQATPTPVATIALLPEDITPQATPAPTPIGPRVDWRTLWLEYEPGMQLAREGKPVLLMFINTESSQSNSFEIWFERAHSSLLYTKEHFTPVRVHAATNGELARQFGVVTVPSLVLLDESGAVIRRRYFDGRASDAELMQFMAGN